MYKTIRQHLLSLQDKKFQQFHTSLCPGTTNIIGIKIPVLRNYAKTLSKQQNIKEYIMFNDTIYYEEVMIQAMLIGTLKELDLQVINNFIPKIYNWAICDTFCSGLKIVQNNKQIFWKLVQKYIKSKKEFEVRFAIVILLNYFLEDEYIDKIFNLLDNVKHNGYYVQMAIAWCISFAFIKFQNKTFIYLQDNKLNLWTYNKSLQKICESLRVSKQIKNKINAMKK